MKQVLYITSPIPPSVNNYLNYRVQKNNFNGRLFVQSYKSEDSLIYENQFLKIAKQAVKEQKWEMPDDSKYIFVESIFYFPKHGMDTNNHWKLPLDVLKAAGIYIDDKRALESARRTYIDAEHPRMELKIYEADFIGIFEDSEHFTKFLNSNCESCKKLPQRCSILRKAVENRLTEDIDLEYNKCNKIKPRK